MQVQCCPWRLSTLNSTEQMFVNHRFWWDGGERKFMWWMWLISRKAAQLNNNGRMIFFEIIALLRDGPSVTAPHVGLENAPFQKRYIYDHIRNEKCFASYIKLHWKWWERSMHGWDRLGGDRRKDGWSSGKLVQSGYKRNDPAESWWYTSGWYKRNDHQIDPITSKCEI